MKTIFKTIKELAEFMHINYELISMKLGWGTQEKCRVKFDDLPKRNKQVMLKVAELVLKDFKKDVLELMKLLESKTSYYEMWKELKERIEG